MGRNVRFGEGDSFHLFLQRLAAANQDSRCKMIPAAFPGAKKHGRAFTMKRVEHVRSRVCKQGLTCEKRGWDAHSVLRWRSTQIWAARTSGTCHPLIGTHLMSKLVREATQNAIQRLWDNFYSHSRSAETMSNNLYRQSLTPQCCHCKIFWVTATYTLLALKMVFQGTLVWQAQFLVRQAQWLTNCWGDWLSKNTPVCSSFTGQGSIQTPCSKLES